MSVLTFSVPEISCGHCKQTIEAAVSPLPGVRSAVVSIDEQVVTVEGEAPEDVLQAAIEESGYTVEGPARHLT